MSVNIIPEPILVRSVFHLSRKHAKNLIPLSCMSVLSYPYNSSGCQHHNEFWASLLYFQLIHTGTLTSFQMLEIGEIRGYLFDCCFQPLVCPICIQLRIICFCAFNWIHSPLCAIGILIEKCKIFTSQVGILAMFKESFDFELHQLVLRPCLALLLGVELLKFLKVEFLQKAICYFVITFIKYFRTFIHVW